MKHTFWRWALLLHLVIAAGMIAYAYSRADANRWSTPFEGAYPAISEALRRLDACVRADAPQRGWGQIVAREQLEAREGPSAQSECIEQFSTAVSSLMPRAQWRRDELQALGRALDTIGGPASVEPLRACYGAVLATRELERLAARLELPFDLAAPDCGWTPPPHLPGLTLPEVLRLQPRHVTAYAVGEERGLLTLFLGAESALALRFGAERATFLMARTEDGERWELIIDPTDVTRPRPLWRGDVITTVQCGEGQCQLYVHDHREPAAGARVPFDEGRTTYWSESAWVAGALLPEGTKPLAWVRGAATALLVESGAGVAILRTPDAGHTLDAALPVPLPAAALATPERWLDAVAQADSVETTAVAQAEERLSVSSCRTTAGCDTTELVTSVRVAPARISGATALCASAESRWLVVGGAVVLHSGDRGRAWSEVGKLGSESKWSHSAELTACDADHFAVSVGEPASVTRCSTKSCIEIALPVSDTGRVIALDPTEAPGVVEAVAEDHDRLFSFRVAETATRSDASFRVESAVALHDELRVWRIAGKWIADEGFLEL